MSLYITTLRRHEYFHARLIITKLSVATNAFIHFNAIVNLRQAWPFSVLKGRGRGAGGGGQGGRGQGAGGRGAGGGNPGEKEVGERGREVGEIGGNTQHCTIFRNRKSAEKREPSKIGRAPGLKGTGSGKFNPPPPFPVPLLPRVSKPANLCVSLNKPELHLTLRTINISIFDVTSKNRNFHRTLKSHYEF